MSEVRELPDRWVIASLNEVATPGGTCNPKTRDDDNFCYVDIEAIDNEAQKIVSPKVLLNKQAPSRARMSIKVGDVLFSLVRPYLKNIAIVPQELDNHVVEPH